MTTSSNDILQELLKLRHDMIALSENRLSILGYEWPDENKKTSAINLSQYMAFRHYDIRPLQDKLSHAGLSSLGRGESHILENIDRVISILQQIMKSNLIRDEIPQKKFNGRKLLQDRNEILFGPSQSNHYTRIMVTLPSEAASEDNLVNDLLAMQMECARINCAHDQPDDWLRMIDFINAAKQNLSRDCRVFMDLGGIKIRTGESADINNSGSKIRLFEDDIFEIRCDAKASVPAGVNPMTNEIKPAIIACSSDEFLDHVKIGDSVWIDDGKMGSIIEAIYENGLKLRVTHAGPKGVRIRSGKGINFPDTYLNLPTLTSKDKIDLDFICQHADILGLSFIQSPEDLDEVFNELFVRDCQLPVVAKIETRQAFENLPDILLKGLSYPGQFAIMIARGDLAIELGSVRMAEIQEEILWLCEAAHTPVIWATQVLETLAKKGRVSRPEITDAAMSVRAECVMLNKGKYIRDALAILRDILDRMQAHQFKKVSRLRALHW